MNILFLGAHVDDIELGCGGTLSNLQRKGHNILYVAFSKCTNIERNLTILDDICNVENYLHSIGVKTLFFDFQNTNFFSQRDIIRKEMEDISGCYHPDLVFTHWNSDIHQDHQVINQESLRVFRNVSMLEYECSRSCPEFVPNYFYILSVKDINNKIDLLSLYKTQKVYYMSPNLIRSTAIVRGGSIGEHYAEGFWSRKIIIK